MKNISYFILAGILAFSACKKTEQIGPMDIPPFLVELSHTDGIYDSVNAPQFAQSPEFKYIITEGINTFYTVEYSINGGETKTITQIWPNKPYTIQCPSSNCGRYALSLRIICDDNKKDVELTDTLYNYGKITDINAYYYAPGIDTVKFSNYTDKLPQGDRFILIKHTPSVVPVDVHIKAEGPINVGGKMFHNTSGDLKIPFTTTGTGAASLGVSVINGRDTSYFTQSFDVTSEELTPSFSFDVSAADIGNDQNLVVEFNNFNIKSYGTKVPEFAATIDIDNTTVLKTNITASDGVLPPVTVPNNKISSLTIGQHSINVSLKLDYEGPDVEFSNSCNFSITYTALIGVTFSIGLKEADEVYIKDGDVFDLLIEPTPATATIKDIKINNDGKGFDVVKSDMSERIYKIKAKDYYNSPAIEQFTVTVCGANADISKTFTVYTMKPINYTVKSKDDGILVTPSASFDITGLSMTVNAKLTYGKYLYGSSEGQFTSSITPIQYIYKPGEGFYLADSDIVGTIESDYEVSECWEDRGYGVQHYVDYDYYYARVDDATINILVNPSYKFYKNLYNGTISKEGYYVPSTLTITTNPNLSK